MPSKHFKQLSPKQQWVANRKFLDRAILRNDKIILSNRVTNIKKVTGAFRKELEYMVGQGYRLNWTGSKLIH
jgi:hypothetical protein